mgnify:FL=1
MYIKYDESELFEFFECEPVPVGDDDAGDLIFTYSDNEFKLILFLSTYETVSYTHLTLPTIA